MKRIFVSLVILAVISSAAYAADAVKQTKEPAKNPVVLIQTNMGDIKVELFANKAPISVRNFLFYVDSGFYAGTIFHRVIPDFMIQGGGFTAEFEEKPTASPIKNEAGNGLKNERGTIAMARTMIVDSATAQFFINVKDNGFLNHRDASMQGYGYAVFGKVIEGMEVVDKIAAVPTGYKGNFSDVPKKEVLIKAVKQLQ